MCGVGVSCLCHFAFCLVPLDCTRLSVAVKSDISCLEVRQYGLRTFSQRQLACSYDDTSLFQNQNLLLLWYFFFFFTRKFALQCT